jgi:hypothetical protein
VVEPGVQGMTEMLQISKLDIQAGTGLNDANLGRPKPDESGKAVLARQKQGDTSTLNFSGNAARGIEATGTIILDLIPKVYTSSRVQRIVRPDDTTSQVGIFNSQNETQEEAEAALTEQNIKKIYDIGTGRYDVAVSVGPSYQSKRQESVNAELALVQAVPQIMPAIGDLIVGNMDWPQAKEIAKRLKKMLPPQLQDNEDQSPEAQLMQAQQQLAALGQQHQQLTQALQQATRIINTKQIENQGKVEIEQHKGTIQMSLEQMKIDAQIAIAEINTKAQNAIERSKMFVDIWNELHGSAHELGMAGMANQAAAQQQQAGAQQDNQSQQSDQMHDVGMAAMSQQGASNQSAQDAAQSNGSGQ